MRTWDLRILHQLLRSTLNTLRVLAATVSGTFKSRAALQLENLALWHQFGVLQRSVKRPKLTVALENSFRFRINEFARLLRNVNSSCYKR